MSGAAPPLPRMPSWRVRALLLSLLNKDLSVVLQRYSRNFEPGLEDLLVRVLRILQCCVKCRRCLAWRCN
jgi:hypothetical protein